MTLFPFISFSARRSGCSSLGIRLSSCSLNSGATSDKTSTSTLRAALKTLVIMLISNLKPSTTVWKAEIVPFSFPSKEGWVATFNPGWGNRKQEILVKHEWMWSLTVCSSSCWDSLTFKNKDSSQVKIPNSEFKNQLSVSFIFCQTNKTAVVPVSVYPGTHCLL